MMRYVPRVEAFVILLIERHFTRIALVHQFFHERTVIVMQPRIVLQFFFNQVTETT